MSPFAAFVVAPVGFGAVARIAATTRAADRGEAGRIGLPGGKIEPGETPAQAAVREAAEEGWRIIGRPVEIHRAMVEGRLVVWLAAERAERVYGHAEAGRITPIMATKSAVARSGYGNRSAMRAYAGRTVYRYWP